MNKNEKRQGQFHAPLHSLRYAPAVDTIPTALPTIVASPSAGAGSSVRCSTLLLLPLPPAPGASRSATPAWNAAREGDTGAGLDASGIDFAVVDFGLPFMAGPGIRGGTRTRTTGEFAGVGFARRASVSASTSAYSPVPSGSRETLSAPLPPRGGEMGIDLLVGDVGTGALVGEEDLDLNGAAEVGVDFDDAFVGVAELAVELDLADGGPSRSRSLSAAVT